MKKLFLVIGLVFAAGLLFTSESPSLDGRAIVAEPGVFPKGLFAKTVGYLPGDTISVTNPANAERVDILVIGSLDPSEGVAVMLSPEAAQALSIKKNSNNLVKLTKRNGNADEVANGSAVIAITTGDGSEETVAEEKAEEKPLSEVIEEAIANGESVEEAEKEAVAAAEEAAADQMFDKAEEEIEGEEAEEAASETAVAEGTEEAPQEDLPEYEVVEDELANEAAEEAEEEFVEADVKDEVPEESVSEVVVSDAVEETPEGEIVEDEYEAIVLVPSESKSPESSFVDEPLFVEEEDKTPAFDALPSASGVAYLDDFSQLASQKYYVQIAVYKSSENVDQIASQYASRYPITVVQQGSKSPVLIGPLTVDEYGVVLERFRSYGFKDAFVKIGK